MKTCRLCKVPKPLSEFSPTTPYKGKPKFRCECRECNSKQAREDYHRNSTIRKAAAKNWKLRNPEKVREIRHRYEYNLTPEEYTKMLESQGFKCPICEKSLIKPFVDHDHKTGKVRGLLCVTCNAGLGKLGDSITGLEKALAYLKKNS